jgi:hypothetical protein
MSRHGSILVVVLVLALGLLLLIFSTEAGGSTICVEPVDGLPLIETDLPPCPTADAFAAAAAPPARFWRVGKAERFLRERPPSWFGRVLDADCKGIGSRKLRYRGFTFWRRFDCRIEQPRHFVTYAVLAPTGKRTYQLLPYGGIG